MGSSHVAACQQGRDSWDLATALHLIVPHHKPGRFALGQDPQQRLTVSARRWPSKQLSRLGIRFPPSVQNPISDVFSGLARAADLPPDDDARRSVQSETT
jgi:hypothetical protein